MMRALVFGREGQVAQALQTEATRRDVALLALGRADLDLLTLVQADGDPTAALALRNHITTFAPTVLINAAAYTAVDRAQTEPDMAFQLNRDVPGHLAAAAQAAGADFIHISTDYVFSGDKGTPYVETDSTGPRSVYGASKLAGEIETTRAHPGAVILRTAWVYSATGSNFVKTMLRLAAAGKPLRVVADQRGCPTAAQDIARAILDIAATRPHASGASGLYHLSGSGETSWHGLAEAIMAGAEIRGAPFVPVEPITTADYPTAAARPANSRLVCAKLDQTFGLRLPEWHESLNGCLDQILLEVVN